MTLTPALNRNHVVLLQSQQQRLFVAVLCWLHQGAAGSTTNNEGMQLGVIDNLR